MPSGSWGSLPKTHPDLLFGDAQVNAPPHSLCLPGRCRGLSARQVYEAPHDADLHELGHPSAWSIPEHLNEIFFDLEKLDQRPLALCNYCRVMLADYFGTWACCRPAGCRASGPALPRPGSSLLPACLRYVRLSGVQEFVHQAGPSQLGETAEDVIDQGASRRQGSAGSACSMPSRRWVSLSIQAMLHWPKSIFSKSPFKLLGVTMNSQPSP